MSEFKVGDLAVLKSGGPIMTIMDILSQDSPTGRAGEVMVHWFTKSGEQRNCMFPNESLVNVSEKSGGAQ